MEKKEFYAHGKLLLTGEYGVLDGALSLALPARYGQRMQVHPLQEKRVFFCSLTTEGTTWFEEELFVGSSNPIAQTLEKILREAQRLQPGFLSQTGARVTTRLEFPQGWGLGSSSTLIAMIAQWALVDPYQLLWNSFGGSGYDIACAMASSPILYQLQEGQAKAYPIYYQPSFANSLFFVYLNQKQNSREGIAHYKAIEKNKPTLIQQLSLLTESVYRCEYVELFTSLISQHEALLSNFLQLPTVKERLFADFEGAIKSLGAWGGDFILAVGQANYVREYFSDKGYTTIRSFEEMILPTDREPILPPSPQDLP